MHSNWWFAVITTVEILALSAAVLSLIWRRQLTSWPFLFASLSLELSVDLVCLSLMGPGHYRPYFMVFWWGQAIQALFRLGVITDILRSFPGLDFIPKKVYLFVGTSALVMSVLAGAYCYHVSPNAPAGLHNFALLMNRCTNIAFGTFAMAILVTVKAFNFGWDPKGAGIATGFFSRICCGVIVAEILSGISGHDPRSIAIRTFANCLDSFCSIAVFSYWSSLVLQNRPSSEVYAHRDVSAYAQNLKTLLVTSFGRER